MAFWQIIIFIAVLMVVGGVHFFILPMFPSISKLHLILFSTVWALLLGAICITKPPYQIDNYTYIIFCLAWVMVYAGHIVACLIFEVEPMGQGVISANSYNFSALRVCLFLIVSLSVLGNYLYYSNLLSNLSGIEAMVSIRTTEGQEVVLESGGVLFNIFGRIYVIYIPLAFFLYKKNRLSLKFLTCLIILALATAAGSFTRAPILFLFIIVFVSLVTLEIRVKWWVYLISGIALISILFYSTSEIIKIQEGGNSTNDFLNSFFLYILGSLVAFGLILKGQYYDPNIYDIPYYSLDFFSYFLKKIGYIDRYPSLVRNYAPGIETNVYTYLDVFALDFGLPGLIFGPFLIGLFCGVFASRAKQQTNLVVLIMYNYCCFALTFSYVNNEFIRSYVLIVLFIVLIIHAFSKIKFNKSQFSII